MPSSLRRSEVPAWLTILFALFTTAGSFLSLYLTYAGATERWPFSGPPDVRIDVVASQLNAPGSDRASDEYVCLVNKSGGSVDLLGWVLSDAEGNVNVLPDVRLESDGHLKVHPGGGASSDTDVYGEGEAAAWNNSGDTITLFDQSGDRIDSQTYGEQSEEGAKAACG